MSETRSLSNPQVADLLGIHFTHASRLRTGQREPSITMLTKIREVLGWSIDEQVTALTEDNYHVELERRLNEWAKVNIDV